MRWLASDEIGRRTRGAGLVALTALAWGVLVPNDLFWTVMVGACLSGSAIATVLVLRRRWTPTGPRAHGGHGMSPAGRLY